MNRHFPKNRRMGKERFFVFQLYPLVGCNNCHTGYYQVVSGNEKLAFTARTKPSPNCSRSVTHVLRSRERSDAFDNITVLKPAQKRIAISDRERIFAAICSKQGQCAMHISARQLPKRPSSPLRYPPKTAWHPSRNPSPSCRFANAASRRRKAKRKKRKDRFAKAVHDL